MIHQGHGHKMSFAVMVVCLLLVQFIAPTAMGGLVWTRKDAAFQSYGIRTNVTVDANGMSLLVNDTGLLDWTNITNSGPGPRYRHSMAYDPVSDQVVLFGGLGDSDAYSDTWVFNFSTRAWTLMTVAQSPTKRWGSGFVYDPDDKVFILFGGNDYSGVLGETWAYDPKTEHWNQLTTTGAIGARSRMAMAYDTDQKLVYAVGGWDGTAGYGQLNETWAFNFQTGQWTQKTAFDLPGRYDNRMDYDPINKVMVMVGSDSGADDVLIYTPSSDTWVQKTLSPSFTLRFGPAVAYDSVRKKIAFSGGEDNAGAIYNDLCFYNYSMNSYNCVSPVNKPDSVIQGAMVYSGANNVILHFGGYDKAYNARADTWIYNMKVYVPEGRYESEVRSLDGPAYFRFINVDGTIPPGTSLGVQIRTGETMSELFAANYVGPNDAVNKYFTPTDKKVMSTHNGSQFMQYRVVLKTSLMAVTPVLNKVEIPFNLLHTLSLVSPLGGEEWDGNKTISWEAFDLDNDKLSFDIILENGSIQSTLAENLSAQQYQWNTNSTPNGTYRIKVVAKDDNTTIPLSVFNTSLDFNVKHLKPNWAPVVRLISPTNSTMVTEDSIELQWTGSDLDGDTLVYHVLLEWGQDNIQVDNVTTESYLAIGLKDGTKYYWTVTAFDGRVNSSVPGKWSFTVKLNKTPKFTSVPGTKMFYGEDYGYLAIAEDPEGKSVNYSLDAAPSGMTIERSTGQVNWTPEESQVGNHNVRVNATDGERYAVQEFNLTVELPAVPINHPPVINSTPIQTAIVGRKYQYQIMAKDRDTKDTMNYTLGIHPSDMTMDLKTGLIQWTPTFEQLGLNDVSVQVSDGKASAFQNYTVFVSLISGNHPPKITSQPPNTNIKVGDNFTYQLAGLDDDSGDNIIFRLASAPQGMTVDKNTGLLRWVPGKDALGQHTVIVNITDGKGGFDQQSFTIDVSKKTAIRNDFDILALLIIIIIVACVVAAVVGVAVWAKRKKAKANAVVIDDIFMIYNDGRLISHHTRQLKPNMDDQILTGMLTAVTDFMKSSMGGDDNKLVNEISYGKDKILLEHGKYIYIAAVVIGEDLKGMHSNMKAAVEKIENEFGPVLKAWEGEVKVLDGAKKWVQMLISGQNVE